MDEEVLELYGSEIPDESVMEDALADVDMFLGNGNTGELQELDTIKMRLKELEEAAELREKLAKVEEEDAELFEKLAIVEKEMDDMQHITSDAAIQTSRELIDSRSVFVGNVDYVCIPENVQQHFQLCRTVNRDTILTDDLGEPKGLAYVEIQENKAVPEDILLNISELHGRPVKVSPKRINISGMKQYYGRYYNLYICYRSYNELFYFSSPYNTYGIEPYMASRSDS